MSNELTIPGEDLSSYGPAMQGLSPLMRRFVIAYCEHPNYDHSQLAQEAGYSAASKGSLKVTGHRLMHDERVIAAINEEASKRLRGSGLLGISVMMQIAANPAHKDQLKAATALADRTGFHALSEHKVTVDDKRPQTKAEMIRAIVALGREQGLSDEEIKKWTGGEIVDAEFSEIDPVDAVIEKQMEDL